jgi:hypothetical protein
VNPVAVMRRRGARPSCRPAAVTLACLGAAALASCGADTGPNGIASQSAERVLARAQAAASSAATVHVIGSIASAARPISIDMELVSGKGGTGHATLGGVDVELIQVNGWLYVRGNAPLMRRLVGATAATKLGRRWLKAPAAHGPLAPLATLTDLRRLIPETLADHHQLSRDGRSTVDGQPTLALADNVERATLYVASTGTPYPLALVKRGRAAGRISFDRWNKPVTLLAPPNPINIKAL